MNWARRVGRAGWILARPSGGLPWWLRWGWVVCLAIPGPVDELILGPALLAVVAVFYRTALREAWHAAGPQGD